MAISNTPAVDGLTVAVLGFQFGRQIQDCESW